MISLVRKLQNRNAWLAWSAVPVAAVFAAPGALAQDSEGGSMVLEEITVTAQRREQSLQEVPISVSAFTADTIQKANITQAADYLVMTPNVGYSEDGEGGSRSINISIRGVSNITLDGIAVANSIGYYIDDLSVGSVAQGTINPQLQDMERIEVLRGPQGTYFGRNAVGGAINIATQKPTEEFYFEGTLGAENFGGFNAQAIINGALSDNLMVRGVFGHETSDTAIKNVNPLGNDPSYDYNTARLSLRALISDRTTFDLSLTFTEEDEGGDIAIPSGIVDLDTQSIFGIGATDAIDSGQGFYPSNDDRVDRDTLERNDKEFMIANGRFTVDFDSVTLKSITGFIDSSFDRESDLDGIPFTFGPLPLRRVNDYEAEAFSQEFRLQSNDSEGPEWTVGVYYAKDEFDRTNQIQILPDDQPSGEPVGFINSNIQDFDFESLAVFGEVTFGLGDNMDLLVGGRYSRDDVDASEVDLNRGPDPVRDSESFTDFSPRVVLRYLPSDELTVYGSVSKGYKAGGTDVTGGSRTEGAPFKSEDLWSYEVGFKSRLNDGRTSLSGALFFLDWEDFQVQTNRLADPNDISSAISTTQNADAASASGLELEMVTLLSENVSWSLNAGYVDSEFDKYPDAVLKGETNGLPNVIDVSGQPLPRTPELSFSTALDFGFEVGSMDGFARIQWSHVDKQYSDIEAIGSLVGETVNGDPFNLPKFPYEIDSYDVVNISAGVSRENFRIDAYIKNALDEQYYTGTADNFGAAGIRLKPHFAVYGVKFTYMTN